MALPLAIPRDIEAFRLRAFVLSVNDPVEMSAADWAQY
jgi:hypothetical protein